MAKIAHIWSNIQAGLFPHLERCFDTKLTERQRQLVAILEIVRIEDHVPPGGVQVIGRPQCDRRALARAFVAKAVYDLPTSTLLIEMLRTQPNLLNICGWKHAGEVPSEATFSRAFAEFATEKLADKVHAALVAEHVGERLVGHVSRDSTAIVAREKPAKKPPQPTTRLPKQITQAPQVALAELPTACDVGVKTNSKGYKHTWIGYKAHFDVNDAGLPLTVVTTSASLHVSQVAIPMEKLTAQRVTSLYSLMDAAYDAELIKRCCRELGPTLFT